jgi:hypothetical protein
MNPSIVCIFPEFLYGLLDSSRIFWELGHLTSHKLDQCQTMQLVTNCESLWVLVESIHLLTLIPSAYQAHPPPSAHHSTFEHLLRDSYDSQS